MKSLNWFNNNNRHRRPKTEKKNWSSTLIFNFIPSRRRERRRQKNEIQRKCSSGELFELSSDLKRSSWPRSNERRAFKGRREKISDDEPRERNPSTNIQRSVSVSYLLNLDEYHDCRKRDRRTFFLSFGSVEATQTTKKKTPKPKRRGLRRKKIFEANWQSEILFTGFFGELLQSVEMKKKTFFACSSLLVCLSRAPTQKPLTERNEIIRRTGQGETSTNTRADTRLCKADECINLCEVSWSWSLSGRQQQNCAKQIEIVLRSAKLLKA